MNVIKMLIEDCRAYAQAKGLSKSAFARQAGLAVNTLRKFWDDDWNPNAHTLTKLAHVMEQDKTRLSLSDAGAAEGGPVIGCLSGKKILLIITGGIAAYKALDLIRRLMDEGASVTGVLTKGGAEFITPLSVAGLSGNPCYTDLFDLKEESEMGHIRLSRDNDLVLVAPATADMMAKMAQGLAGDLATTLLLATDKPVMIAPAMNSQMWAHPATARNLGTLQGDGVQIVDPAPGLLACGEVGMGKLADVMDIVGAVKRFFYKTTRKSPLANRKVVLTAGPTHEAIDPVRYIANRSSGKQGFSIAKALYEAGADVTLVAGPVSLPTPNGVKRIDVESARDMKEAVDSALPADIAIFVAAVADWRTEGAADQKMKKDGNGLPALKLTENPDILASVAQRSVDRPALVIGFAAETENILDHAQAKRARKGCDWIVANDVSHTDNDGVMGGDFNQVHILSADGVQSIGPAVKSKIAEQIVDQIIAAVDSGHL